MWRELIHVPFEKWNESFVAARLKRFYVDTPLAPGKLGRAYK
jgi:hypothetical protein